VTEGNLAADETKLLTYRVGCVEGKPKVSGQRIRASERDHTDGYGEIFCDALNDLVQRAVTAAREDEFCTGSGCIGSLGAGGSGRVGGNDLGFDAARVESSDCRLQRSVAQRPATACVWIKDQGGAPH
jgi:hypothetical protein